MELIAALIIGLVAGFFVARYFFQKVGEEKENSSLKVAEEKLSITEKNQAELKEVLERERTKAESLLTELASTKNEAKNLEYRLEEQKAELEKLQEKFTKEFENIANRILDEKTQKFTEQNKVQLQYLLNPLGERLIEFSKRIQDNHTELEKERSALKEQLRNLTDMNKRMSEEANNLTRALKGDVKIQGNWGELVLEKILEKSGLEQGREYSRQMSITTVDNQRIQPDVVVHLPGDKHIVVDSKVSLVHYERLITAEDPADKERFLKEHIQSVRQHVKGLSAKGYARVFQDRSPDFVLMFIPIEPAFSLAVGNDAELFNEAFDRNVVLVTPATLLATLRTITNIWKQEKQTQNAREIARQAGEMYDKFVAFGEDLIKVGKKMDEGKGAYLDAMNKLLQGRGNLLSRSQKLKELGIQVSKEFPPGLLERVED